MFDDKMDINFENHNIALKFNDNNVVLSTLYFRPAVICFTSTFRLYPSLFISVCLVAACTLGYCSV